METEKRQSIQVTLFRLKPDEKNNLINIINLRNDIKDYDLYSKIVIKDDYLIGTRVETDAEFGKRLDESKRHRLYLIKREIDQDEKMLAAIIEEQKRIRNSYETSERQKIEIYNRLTITKQRLANEQTQ